MAKDRLRIIPLGGLGEIGKNMMVLEFDDQILVIDCGVMFPEEEMLGVDLVIPDITYLREHRDKILAILITHGHEDHIGALPFLLPELDVPVYCTKLTHGLISVKLKEHGLLESSELNIIAPGQPFKLGPFGVEAFRVNHSIPDAVGYAIRTPVGTVVHTGDFKFDHTPVDGLPADFARLAELGREGVLLLLSDSTYAEVPGYTPSELVVGRTLHHLMAEAPGRVIIATFASLISRIQQVIDASAKNQRRVFVFGRSMVDNVAMALELGYLSAPDGLLGRPDELRRMRPNQVSIITTGAQGEPTSALVRMANRDHRQVRIVPGDTVVLSSTPIPGNEALVYRTIDNLFKQGADVLHSKVAEVHVHGHAAQEELKLLLNLVTPKFFVPIHGEYRHLVAHTKLAASLGIGAERCFVLEDGNVLELGPTGGRVESRLPYGHVYVDGVGELAHVVLRDRKLLSLDGILVVIMAIDKQTGRLVTRPDIVSRGFIEARDGEPLLEETKDLVVKALEQTEKHSADWSFVQTQVRETLGRFLYERTRRRPMILPVAVEV